MEVLLFWILVAVVYIAIRLSTEDWSLTVVCLCGVALILLVFAYPVLGFVGLPLGIWAWWPTKTYKRPPERKMSLVEQRRVIWAGKPHGWVVKPDLSEF